MERSEQMLRARARRAYELSRLATSLPAACLALPPAVLAASACGGRSAIWLQGSLLGLLLVGLLWRGEEYGRAVRPGILAGYGAFLLPWLAVAAGACPLGGSPLLFLLCTGAGLLIGLGLTLRCLYRHCCSTSQLLATGAVAGLTAALGCATAGLAGLLGMGVALACAATPAFIVVRQT